MRHGAHPAAPYAGAINDAYHFDAGLLADFLREICIARGVVHVHDTVVGAEHDARGHIAALQLKDGGRRPVELVLDCSGFRGVLINEALAEPFVSYADYLPNDRAITIQIAHDDRRALLPATVSAASDAGWTWRIPLQSRIGTGHVYASAFLDDVQAADRLVARNAGFAQLTDPRDPPARRPYAAILGGQLRCDRTVERVHRTARIHLDPVRRLCLPPVAADVSYPRLRTRPDRQI